MTQPALAAFADSSSCKTYWLDLLRNADTQGARAWDYRKESLTCWLLSSTETQDFERHIGLAGGLTGMIDRLADFSPQSAVGALCDTFDAIAVGVDTACIPSRLVLHMLDNIGSQDDERVRRCVALHRREADADAVPAGEWRILRRALREVGMTPGNAVSSTRDRAMRMAEATAWPVRGSPAALSDVTSIHMEGPIGELTDIVRVEYGWTDHMDLELQRAFQRRNEGMETARDNRLIERLGVVQTVFEKRKSEVTSPYWSLLQRLVTEVVQ